MDKGHFQVLTFGFKMGMTDISKLLKRFVSEVAGFGIAYSALLQKVHGNVCIKMMKSM